MNKATVSIGEVRPLGHSGQQDTDCLQDEETGEYAAKPFVFDDSRVSPLGGAGQPVQPRGSIGRRPDGQELSPELHDQGICLIGGRQQCQRMVAAGRREAARSEVLRILDCIDQAFPGGQLLKVRAWRAAR